MERDLEAPDCGTVQQRYIRCPYLLTLATCFFSPPLRYLSVLTFLNSLFFIPLLWILSHFCLIYPCLWRCILFTFFLLHAPFSFILLLLPPSTAVPLPPCVPQEIWFPPLPGPFTMIPVCMADKDHIAPSIWRHFSWILYTRSFMHLRTLNTIETTNILCVGMWQTGS